MLAISYKAVLPFVGLSRIDAYNLIYVVFQYECREDKCNSLRKEIDVKKLVKLMLALIVAGMICLGCEKKTAPTPTTSAGAPAAEPNATQ